MKQIELTQGKVALVDDEDFEELSKFKWCVFRMRKTKFYAVRAIKRNNKYGLEYMHRRIMKDPVGLVIDHINHDGLDNRKANLRAVTTRENSQNLEGKSTGKYSSKYPGVNWHKTAKKWFATVFFNGKYIRLGQFDTENEAAKAYGTFIKKNL